MRRSTRAPAVFTAVVALVFLALARSCAANLQSGALRTIDGDDDGTLMARERYALDGALALEPLRATGVETRDIRVTLATEFHGKMHARVRGDGTFVVRDAPAGTHVLSVRALGLTYPPVEVRVRGVEGGEGGDDVEVEATYAEDRSVVLETKPLRLVPVSRAEYFEPASSVSLAGLMKNPMALMVIMSVFLAYVAPKILEGIDREELQRMQEEMAGMTGGAAKPAVGGARPSVAAGAAVDAAD